MTVGRAALCDRDRRTNWTVLGSVDPRRPLRPAPQAVTSRRPKPGPAKLRVGPRWGQGGTPGVRPPSGRADLAAAAGARPHGAEARPRIGAAVAQGRLRRERSLSGGGRIADRRRAGAAAAGRRRRDGESAPARVGRAKASRAALVAKSGQGPVGLPAPALWGGGLAGGCASLSGGGQWGALFGVSGASAGGGGVPTRTIDGRPRAAAVDRRPGDSDSGRPRDWHSDSEAQAGMTSSLDNVHLPTRNHRDETFCCRCRSSDRYPWPLHSPQASAQGVRPCSDGPGPGPGLRAAAGAPGDAHRLLT